MQPKGPQRNRFSLTTFPDALHFNAAVVLFAAGVAACFFLPFMIPDLNKDGAIQTQINRVPLFELKNEIQAGQYRLSPHEGDTRASFDATFWAVSILSSKKAQGLGLSYNQEKTKSFVLKAEARDFDKNIEGIYEGISLLKTLGSLDSKFIEKYYSAVLQLSEPNSGFRHDMTESASIRATYYAFEIMRELGKFEQFQTTQQWTNSINFVNSLKHEGAISGFANRNGENITLEGTYFALKVLPQLSISGIENFVYLCQGADGGFHFQPVDTMARLYQYQSSIVSTVFGISVLKAVSPFDNRAHLAKNYLRSQLLFAELNLEAIYETVKLLEAAQIELSAPSSVPSIIYSVGVFSLFAALLSFYKPQIPEDSFAGAYAQLFNVFLFLAGAAIVSRISGQLALIAYTLLSFYLVVKYYDTQSADTNDGEMLLVSIVNSLIFLGVAITFSSLYPFVFGSTLVYAVLLGWAGVASLVASFGANYFISKQKVSFFVKSGFLAWVTNTMILYSVLVGRPDLGFVFRLIETRNIWPFILVGYPITSLGVTYFGSALGYLLYNPSKFK